MTDDKMFNTLCDWIEQDYREKLYTKNQKNKKRNFIEIIKNLFSKLKEKLHIFCIEK